MAHLSSIEGRTRPAKVQSEVVEALSQALELAKEGKIISVALALVHSDNDIQVLCPPTDSFYKLLGAVTQLQFDMMSARCGRGE